jgi:S-adenosylmethionine synthetase
VNTFGTGKIDEEILEKYIIKNFDMRPKALIEELDLLKPIYRKTAAYGHFGRDEFTWEQTDRAAKMADDLLKTSKAVDAAQANGTAAKAKKRGKGANADV